jgi:predicted permease
MDAAQRVFTYFVRPISEEQADLTILLGAACLALAAIFAFCALAAPGEPDDPDHSVIIASSFG